MDIIGQARARVHGRKLRVVLPEGGDARIVEAARRLTDEDLAAPVLIGADPTEFDTVDPSRSSSPAIIASILRRREGMETKTASRLLSKPLYLGGALVAASEAHALVAGVANPTRRVIEAALMTIGMEPGIKTPSSYFLMTCPSAIGGSKVVMFADCAVNASPSAETLADIAIASAQSAAQLFGQEPRVALLSFSTHGSAQHGDVDKVLKALALAKELRPELMIDGELQGDAALSPLIAAKKTKGGGSVAGHANVLIFPDLDAGNIAYKLVQYLGGATATGPFLQGFAKPVSDLSRGATVDDIVATVVMTLAKVSEHVGQPTFR